MKKAVIVVLAGLLVVSCPKKNRVPDAPSVPSGPSAVAKDSLASFSSAATDPDGDSVCIRFDWGDGDTSDWSQYVASSESVLMTHAWTAAAVCSVRAQAKDQRSLTSAWSSVHTVQVGDTWSRTFGGGYWDIGHSVQPTSDGGYIIAGQTHSYGAGWADVWLIKTDADGNKVWDKTFGGEDYDAGYSVQLTSDGGYVVAGSIGRGSGNCDVWLIRTDADGDKVWDRTFGGESWDYGRSVQQTSEGGYIIAGATHSYGAGGYDVWLIKTDADGNKVWDKTFGGESDDEGYSVQQTSEGGYIIAVATDSYGAGDGDVWLIKTDANGSKVWDRTFGGVGADRGYSVQQTSDGGYIVAGSTESLGEVDVWLIKTDAGGNKVWDRTLGGTGDCAYSVQQTSDGGYIIVGETWSYGAGECDVWLVKTDGSGEKVWDKTFGGESDDEGYSVQQTSDGGYIVVGETWSYGAGMYDVWLIKTSGP
jgi:hypothetical protein